MQSPFEPCDIPRDADFIFVNDFLLSDLVGGAELTTAAIVEQLLFVGAKAVTIRSSQLTPTLISENRDKLWLLCNYASADIRCITMVMQICRYGVIEYDFKFCSRRSPDKHKAETGGDCLCASERHGVLVSDLLTNAVIVIWMSEKQRAQTLAKLTNARPQRELIASSVFSDETLTKIAALREAAARTRRSASYAILKSDSWIKGTAQSLAAAATLGLQTELLGGIAYDAMLQKLSTMSGVVYHPPGGDTCPRFIIEAKLLGLETHVNENVLHADESWFSAASSAEHLHKSLVAKRAELIDALLELRVPQISGYVTTLDCVKRGYPIADCVTSMSAFCAEIVICDGGSSDNTLLLLSALKLRPECELKIIHHKLDMSADDFAIQDGLQKARARAACTKPLCWQQDADEIVDPRDVANIWLLASKLPASVDVLCLPVIEFWGSAAKIRADITPWKWRLSRNKKTITHGIPRELRAVTQSGRQYAMHGTDGCDMIDSLTGDRTPSASFMSQAAEADRLAGLRGDVSALKRFETWFNDAVIALPPVFHVSWLDIPRKLRLYREYWTAHWASLYNEKPVNNFFDADWCDVSDQQIDELAMKLQAIGGWIWHRPWDGSLTPHIKLRRPLPNVIARMERAK